MSKRKAGIPAGFTLDIPKAPENDKPIRAGDYLDEIDILTHPVRTTPHTPKRTELPATPAAIVKPEPAPVEEEQPARNVLPSSSWSLKRTRLNVSLEGRKRVAAIVERMAKYGPEPDVRASEVIEALVLALYDAREQLDLSNVRRRGKYGSASHKNFPIALAESIAKAITSTNNSK